MSLIEAEARNAAAVRRVLDEPAKEVSKSGAPGELAEGRGCKSPETKE